MRSDAWWIGQATFRLRAAIVVTFVWALTLLMPALHMRFETGGEVRILAGYQVLMSGWIGLASLQLGWFANPLLGLMVVAWMSTSFSDRAARRAAVALIVASMWTVDLPLRPAFYHFEGFGAGYWFWLLNNLGSAAMVLAGTRRGRKA